MKPMLSVDSQIWRGRTSKGARILAAEVPVAFVYDGGTEEVMMATPSDLEDFALGFSLNDGVVASADDIISLDVVEVEQGVELRMVLRQRNRDGTPDPAACTGDDRVLAFQGIRIAHVASAAARPR